MISFILKKINEVKELINDIFFFNFLNLKVTERFKVTDCKSVVITNIVGSNPTLSILFILFNIFVCILYLKKLKNF